MSLRSAHRTDLTKSGSTCLPVGAERQGHQQAYTTKFKLITSLKNLPTRFVSYVPAPDPRREGYKHHDVYLHKLGTLDPLDDTIDRRVWEFRDYPRDSHRLPHETNQTLVERCRKLSKPPQLAITLHTESFDDAISCFRSDFFFPVILKSCIRYLHVEYRHRGLLREGIEEHDSYLYESGTRARMIQNVVRLGRCWNQVRILDWGFAWDADDDGCTVYGKVEVRSFAGIPHGV